MSAQATQMGFDKKAEEHLAYMEKVAASNRGFVASLNETEDGKLTKASSLATDYTRAKQREDGIWGKILTLTPISTDQLSRTWGQFSEQLVFVADMEPNSPAAVSVALGGSRVVITLAGERYPVFFDWLQTKKMRKNVLELSTYTSDLRQIVSDNAIKDMLAEQDAKGLQACEAAVGSPNTPNPLTGVIQNRVFSGNITRNTWKKAMQQAKSTPANIRPAIALMNHVTLEEFFELDTRVFGDTLAQESFQTGVSVFKEVSGVQILATIKRDLVPDNVCWFFGHESFMGKFLSLRDTVMSIKREDMMVYMYAYGCYGSEIGNVASITKVAFNDGVSSLPLDEDEGDDD